MPLFPRWIDGVRSAADRHTRGAYSMRQATSVRCMLSKGNAGTQGHGFRGAERFPVFFPSPVHTGALRIGESRNLILGTWPDSTERSTNEGRGPNFHMAVQNRATVNGLCSHPFLEPNTRTNFGGKVR